VFSLTIEFFRLADSAKGAKYNSQGQVPTWSGRRPWIDTKNRGAALKGRNTISALQASVPFLCDLPGATCSLRFALAPGYYIAAPLAL
jgi:hypothetical protein